MRRTIMIASCFLCCAVAVFGQGVPGSIQIFNDQYPAVFDCNLATEEPGLVNLNIVHVGGVNVREVAFKLYEPPCVQLTYVGEVIYFRYASGTAREGIQISYGGCMNQPQILLGFVSYFHNMASPDYCCEFSIVPDPRLPFGEVLVLDCDGAMMYATGGRAIANPVPGVCDCVSPVPVEDATWGGIKALYR